ncbi:protoporphyrinogen oxidase [Fictibacillus phosphorivorans]|uniref:protoporphyrinogen oxidase n=1 Tax=Fictibacillus phosphorivorans TaxID=1221500 RepID=UPI00204165A7|nr:protoporphyrinogen oxidase [Fictibacillus phosphorivorans]MCM3717478.1 protoporphyrinogen oxidase [Fictibacillus phosphorivorans]MCM3775173.1 protoporphyrinogen oxidase [Fictibacillus phosphorivorans]
MSERKHVVILGGGITGLAAAFYVQKYAKETREPLTFTLLESSNRLGGKIETIQENGFVIERGPDSYLARKTVMTDLAKEVGLENDLVSNETGQAYILHNMKLHPIPEGAVMGVPTKVMPFMFTPLFSIFGKARASFDLVLPKRADSSKDISVGHFFRRRLGDEVVDRLIEPLLSGIYAGKIDQLSLQSTFPQFIETEKKHRSLILGMKSSQPKPVKAQKAGKKKGAFLTFKNGLSSFVDALAQSLPDTSIKMGAKAESVVRFEDGTYSIKMEDGSVLSADHVIVTTPYAVTKKLFDEKLFPAHFHKTKPTSVATVAMEFNEDEVSFSLDGTGFVIAKSEKTSITACTWTSRKWPHTTPKGKVLLRCYVGRAEDQGIVHESDEVILDKVLNDLKKIMGVDTRPDKYYVSRMIDSMPQYEVDHKEYVKELRATFENVFPGVHFAGAPYDGVGLPDCVNSAKKAVESLLTK